MSIKTPPAHEHDCESCKHLETMFIYEAWFDLYYCEKTDGGTLIARFSSEGPDYSSFPVDIYERNRMEISTLFPSGERDFLTIAQRYVPIEYAYILYLKLKKKGEKNGAY